jgi:basic membrane protein A
VLPGFKFEEALGKAQDEYPDITFIAVDAEPLVGYDNNGAPMYEVKENTISIFFAEQQASFLTGIASALETKTNKVAFLGGMEVPAVQKLGWGFVAGVAYANANLGTNVEIIDYIYQGTFTDLDAGKSISAGMYDKGADVIFAAAGAVGVGAITESKTRAESGEDVYVVGVDVDQYDEGLLTNGHSTILTSAMKYLGEAAYNQIDSYVKGEFEGGQTILMDIATNGVGLPQENPNLSEETVKQVNEIVELIKGGEIEVPATEEALMLFLEDLGQDFGKLNY